MPLNKKKALPQEIWIDIAQLLDAEDLFNLRLCCKRLNRIVSSRAIWKPRCYQNWLNHQSHDLLNEDITPRIDDWFYYYRSRNRIDQHLGYILKQISQECDGAKNQESLRLLLRYKPPMVIPLLHRTVKRGFLGQNASFDVVTLCQRLLTTFRHRHVYELFSNQEETSEFVHNAEETFFLPLAAIDPSFDRLLHFRTIFFERIHVFIKKEFNNLEDFLRLPTTLRVDKLICYLLEALDIFNSDRHLFLEDFMLLRIYAGETAGHPLVILSIIQSLASRYGVETVLCGSYLIIHDSRLKDRETYLTFSSAGVPKIFTRRRLIQSLKRIVGSSDYIIRSEILPSILLPLKHKELLTTVFKELLPQYCKSKWSSATAKTMEEARRLFPFSNQPMNVEAVNYFLCVFKAVDIRWKTELRVSVLYTITHKEVFRLISKLFPGDFIYAEDLLKCKGHDFGKTQYLYSDWLLQLHNISVRKSDAIGLFVISPRDRQLMCVVGVREFNNDVYYTLMNFLGEFYVEQSNNVALSDETVKDSCIKEFLCLASQSDLGLVFCAIDWHSRKLIVNPKIQDVLEHQE